MFKKITSLIFIFFVIIILVGCTSKKRVDKYKEEAGVYELDFMEGDLNKSSYESYTIELKADGKFYLKAVTWGIKESVETEGKFKIRDNKITMIIKDGSETITKEYDYSNGLIIMNNVTEEGKTFSATFKRHEEEVLGYEKEAGVYELISMTGDINMSMFKTYTIELKADGKVNVRATYTSNPTVYDVAGTFEIKNNKIYLYTKVGTTVITEEYDYYTDKIIMKNITIENITFTAIFQRKSN